MCTCNVCVYRGMGVCVCAQAWSLVFRCILCSVRGEVESCLSPSAPSPVKLPVFATTWLLSISLQPSSAAQQKEKVRDVKETKESKIHTDKEREGAERK